MNGTQAKTIGVAGVAGALVTLAIAGLSHYGITVGQDVSDALLTLAIAGLGWVSVALSGAAKLRVWVPSP